MYQQQRSLNPLAASLKASQPKMPLSAKNASFHHTLMMSRDDKTKKPKVGKYLYIPISQRKIFSSIITGLREEWRLASGIYFCQMIFTKKIFLQIILFYQKILIITGLRTQWRLAGRIYFRQMIDQLPLLQHSLIIIMIVTETTLLLMTVAIILMMLMMIITMMTAAALILP